MSKISIRAGIRATREAPLTSRKGLKRSSWYNVMSQDKTCHVKTSLVAQMVKCLPTMQKTRVQSLGREDLLEKEVATHSSILAWKIPWMEEPGRLWSMGSQRVGHDWATSLSFFLQGIFLTQGLNPSLLHCRQILYHLSYREVQFNCLSNKIIDTL